MSWFEWEVVIARHISYFTAGSVVSVDMRHPRVWILVGVAIIAFEVAWIYPYALFVGLRIAPPIRFVRVSHQTLIPCYLFDLSLSFVRELGM